MYRGPKTWEIVPQHIKEASNLYEFKRKIKLWKPQGCTCRMCKVYIINLRILIIYSVNCIYFMKILMSFNLFKFVAYLS